MEFEDILVYVFYGLPGIALTGYVFWRLTHHLKSKSALTETNEAGGAMPATLHPIFDLNKCMGCASCVAACPETKHKVIGMIKRKAHLVNPSSCIGHGACKTACPFDAIKLVFGSAERGVDIPLVKPNFETNVPGIFIAGELGGMGLIRNAITQGTQAMQSVKKLIAGKKSNPGILDVVIVGAGPAGFAATLGAMEAKLKSVTIEQDTFGGTVAHFPRGKLVMTASVTIPLEGVIKLRETSKEALMAMWHRIAKKHRVKLNTSEAMLKITHNGANFEVKTSKGLYHTHTVLLSIGRRGTPRKLNVPGEDKTKVVYRLDDPEQYKDKRVLIVGGGDSALEAACSIADVSGPGVVLSYRSGSFSRAKPKNKKRVETTEKKGKLKVLLKSNVKEIHDDFVILDCEGKSIEVANDAVIISAGGVLPTGMLRDMGVDIETKYGTE